MLSSWNENFDIDQTLAIDDSQMEYSEIKRQRKLSWFLCDKEKSTLDKQIAGVPPDDLSHERTIRRPINMKEVTGTTNGMTEVGSPQKCKTNVVKVPEDNCTLNVRQNTEYELRRTICMQQKIIDHLKINNSINPLRGVNNFSDSISSLRHSPNPCGVPKSGNGKGLLETHRESNAQGERNKKNDCLSKNRHLSLLREQQSRSDIFLNYEAQNSFTESYTPNSYFAGSSSGYEDATEFSEDLILCGNVNRSNNSDIDSALDKGIIEKESANYDRKDSDELNTQLLPLMSSSDDAADSSDYEDVEDLENDMIYNRNVDWTVNRVKYKKKGAFVEENNIREYISQVDTPMTCPNSTASCSEYADVTEVGTDAIFSHDGSAVQIDTRKNDLPLSRENNETRVVNAKSTDILDTIKNIAKKGKSGNFKYSFCAHFCILALCNLLVILSGVSLTLVTVYRKQDLCLECKKQDICLECKELSSLKTELHPFRKEDGRCCLSSIQQLFEIFANVTSEAQRARTQEKQDSILAGLLHHATIPVVQCNAKRTEKFGNVTRIAWEIDSRRPAHKGFEKLGPGNNTLINIPVAGYYYLFSRVHYRTSHDAAEKFLTLGHSVVLVRENLEEKIDSVEDTMYLKAKFTSHTSHLSFVHNFTEKDSLYLRLDNQKYFNKFNTFVGLFFIQKADDLKQVLSEKPAIIEDEQSDTMYR